MSNAYKEVTEKMEPGCS